MMKGEGEVDALSLSHPCGAVCILDLMTSMQNIGGNHCIVPAMPPERNCTTSSLLPLLLLFSLKKLEKIDLKTISFSL
jgi:hypothetical protein